MSQHLFAYGTLMFPEIVGAIIGRRPILESATLENFGRFLIRGEIYAVAAPAAGQALEGKLVHDLTDSELDSLDAFEGQFYVRSNVVVRTEFHSAQPALLYVAAPGREAAITDQLWSPEDFQRDHLPGYLERL